MLIKSSLPGGAVFVYTSSTVSLMISLLHANTALSGGAIFLNSETMSSGIVQGKVSANLTNVTISGNAGQSGGGLALTSSADLSVAVSCFSENKAGQGSSIHSASKTLDIRQTAFGPSLGTWIYLDDAHMMLKNSLLTSDPDALQHSACASLNASTLNFAGSSVGLHFSTGSTVIAIGGDVNSIVTVQERKNELHLVYSGTAFANPINESYKS